MACGEDGGVCSTIQPGLSRRENTDSQQAAKKELISKGRSHRVIVYRDGKPVGWCQYGVKKELPRIDSSSKYPEPVPGEGDKLSRITCFFVDRRNRRPGVGRFALDAALDAIRKKGGGLVEAYPSTKRIKGQA